MYLSGFAPGREARSQPGVTVAGGPRGPIGYGREPRALHRAIVRSTYIRPRRGVVHLGHRIIESDCTTLGPGDENSCCCRSGHSPLTVAMELVVSLKTTNTDHGVAGCVCRACVYVREAKWAIVYPVVDGKESKTECTFILCTHALEIEACERNVLSGSRVPSALVHP